MPPLQKPGHYRYQTRQLKGEKDQAQNTTNIADKNNIIKGSGQTNSNYSINSPTKPTQKKQVIKKTEDLDLSTHPVRPVVKLNTPQRNVFFGANAINRPPPRNRRPERQNQVQQRNAQSNSGGNVQAATQTLK